MGRCEGAESDLLNLPEVQKEAAQRKAVAAATLAHLPLLAADEIKKLSEQPTNTTLALFPVVTTSLSPGKVITRSIALPALTRPIFLVGNDTLSQDWLAAHAGQLKQLQALGFVVQAQNATEFEHLQKQVPDLPLIPLSGDSLAAAWQLTHYPVLISAHAIEQ